MLEDTGERDEYGMEPVDRLFSSPDKGTNGNGYEQSASDDEQDMDIDEGRRVVVLRTLREANVSQPPLWDPRQ